MSQKVIGIEIGAAALKLALVKNGKVVKLAVETLPDHMVTNGHVTAPGAMSQFIKMAMKKNKIRGKYCSFVLPPQLVVSQKVTLPQMNEAELKLNLPFEFKDYVGRDADEYEYDYIVTDIHEGVMDLYAAAVRKQMVEEYYDIFRRAGLTLKLAMPAEMAWLNVITNAKKAPKELCIIDIGHEKTRINIYRDGLFVMGKDIEFAGALFDETISLEQGVDTYVARSRKESNLNNIQTLESLKQPYGTVALEVMKAMTFYSYADGMERQPIRDMYLCGGSANIEILRNAIVKATDMVPHHITKLLKVKDDQSYQALRCGLAIGAALQSIKEA